MNGSGAPGPLCRPIVLVGLMGAGKSSVGLRLASALGVEFIDSDDEIERAANMTIPEIFSTFGEPHFRSGERRVIARLITEMPRVIATGGGAFMNAETRGTISDGAVSVWLNADIDTLVSRTEGRTHRPLLANGNPREILEGLIAERYPIYRLADVGVISKAGQTHEQMAARIIAALAEHGAAFQEGPGRAQS
ncbi:MAG: shikimate kinase [Pseudomonadota bacterium]